MLVLMMLIAVGTVMISIVGRCFLGALLAVLVAVFGMVPIVGMACLLMVSADQIMDLFHGHTVQIRGIHRLALLLEGQIGLVPGWERPMWWAWAASSDSA